MSLITLKQLLEHAMEHDYAVPAFNINDLEQCKAIMNAAVLANSPVIIQISKTSFDYIGASFLKYLIKSIVEKYKNIPICIHQDHGYDINFCKRCIDLGFSSIMYDGSLKDGIVAKYDHNVFFTKQAVNIAHNHGVSVEGELGCLQKINKNSDIKNIITNPDQALDFINITGIDALAISIGNNHGINKFNKPPEESTLDIENIKLIRNKIPNIPLVLHGSSTLPHNLIDDINKYGGNIKSSYGMPILKIKKAITYGVRKVNIDTDLRLIVTATIRKYFFNNKNVYDSRKYNKEAMNNITRFCFDKYNEIGSCGYGDKIKIISLEKMKKYYKK